MYNLFWLNIECGERYFWKFFYENFTELLLTFSPNISN